MESKARQVIRRLQGEMAKFEGRRNTPELRMEIREAIREFEARLEREGVLAPEFT